MPLNCCEGLHLKSQRPQEHARTSDQGRVELRTMFHVPEQIMGKYLPPGEAESLREAFVLGNGFVSNCFPRAWSRACYTGQVLSEFWEGREEEREGDREEGDREEGGDLPILSSVLLLVKEAWAWVRTRLLVLIYPDERHLLRGPLRSAVEGGP